MRGQLYAPPKFFKEHKNGRVASPNLYQFTLNLLGMLQRIREQKYMVTTFFYFFAISTYAW